MEGNDCLHHEIQHMFRRNVISIVPDDFHHTELTVQREIDMHEVKVSLFKAMLERVRKGELVMNEKLARSRLP